MRQHQYTLIASILFCMLVFLLPLSIAATSICVGAICVISLVYFIQFPFTFTADIRVLMASFIGYYLLSLVSLSYTSQLDSGLQKLLLKLPLLFVPFIYLCYRKADIIHKISFEQLFVWSMSIVALISTIHYYQHKADLDFMVLQNKPIPVLSHIYHIEFSIMLALSIVVAAYRLFFFKWHASLLQILFIVSSLIGTYAIHIMAVRTGLLTLYAGILTLGLCYILKYKKYKLLITLPVILLAAFAIIYSSSESFKNRVTLTLDDINVLKTDRDRNWHSVSMRVDAFNNGITLQKANLLLGVGIGDVDREVMVQFAKDSSKLQLENRKKPHHQFLENGLQSGLLSPLLLLFILSIPILFNRFRNPISLTFVVMAFMAMQFESILERQASLVIFCILYIHFISLKEQ